MLTGYLARGLKAGVVAGAAFGLFLALVANPLVGAADGLAHEGGGHGVAAEHSAVSATVTTLVSIGSGVLWGLLLGAVAFGGAFYLLEPSLPGTGPAKSYALAGAGFLTVSGAPWLALPPRPPGAEQALPTDTRMLVYAGMMLAGGVACLLAGAAYSRGRARRGPLVGALGAVCPLALLAVPAAVAPDNPAVHSLPSGLAAATAGLVVFGQATLWVVLGTVHARLHRRATGDGTDRSPNAPDHGVTAD